MVVIEAQRLKGDVVAGRVEVLFYQLVNSIVSGAHNSDEVGHINSQRARVTDQLRAHTYVKLTSLDILDDLDSRRVKEFRG